MGCGELVDIDFVADRCTSDRPARYDSRAAAGYAKQVFVERLRWTSLSGVTPGDREWLDFPSREPPCAARIIAHARPDSLAYSCRPLLTYALT